MTGRSRTRFPRMTRRLSLTSATRLSSGWMPTNWLKSRSLMTNRRRLRVFATPSSPSSTLTLEEPQEVCLTWVAWEVCQELELELLQVAAQEVLDQPSKRLINTT